ncbi:MAG: hypothetical protein NVSMB57_09120 [Actinomycetota bacterium]
MVVVAVELWDATIAGIFPDVLAPLGLRMGGRVVCLRAVHREEVRAVLRHCPTLQI